MERKGLYTQGLRSLYERCVKADLALHVDYCGISQFGKGKIRIVRDIVSVGAVVNGVWGCNDLKPMVNYMYSYPKTEKSIAYQIKLPSGLS